MENEIKVEFIAKMDKGIYANSPWKTKEEFFKAVFTEHVDEDVPVLEAHAKEFESPEKEEYDSLIQTMKDMKNSINESIKYELLNVSGNIEEVKISFNFKFKYHEEPICSLERVINHLVFNSAINDSRSFAEDIEKSASMPKNAGVDKSKVDSTVKMLHHVADFMDDAKSSLVVTKDGVVIGNTFLIEEQKKSKNKP